MRKAKESLFIPENISDLSETESISSSSSSSSENEEKKIEISILKEKTLLLINFLKFINNDIYSQIPKFGLKIKEKIQKKFSNFSEDLIEILIELELNSDIFVKLYEFQGKLNIKLEEKKIKRRNSFHKRNPLIDHTDNRESMLDNFLKVKKIKVKNLPKNTQKVISNITKSEVTISNCEKKFDLTLNLKTGEKKILEKSEFSTQSLYFPESEINVHFSSKNSNIFLTRKTEIIDNFDSAVDPSYLNWGKSLRKDDKKLGYCIEKNSIKIIENLKFGELADQKTYLIKEINVKNNIVDFCFINGRSYIAVIGWDGELFFIQYKSADSKVKKSEKIGKIVEWRFGNFGDLDAFHSISVSRDGQKCVVSGWNEEKKAPFILNFDLKNLYSKEGKISLMKSFCFCKMNISKKYWSSFISINFLRNKIFCEKRHKEAYKIVAVMFSMDKRIFELSLYDGEEGLVLTNKSKNLDYKGIVSCENLEDEDNYAVTVGKGDSVFVIRFNPQDEEIEEGEEGF